MSKIDLEDYTSDYDDWSEDYSEQKGARRKNGRGQSTSRSSDLDDIWGDDEGEPIRAKGRKSRDHRRDIEDRLERRRLEREIYDDYFNDMA
ncbi:hypothetical protein QKW35_20460 [Pontibacterium granulatum]|uniref:PA3496 family putative envelope integrity protein n=1 Tax=Pontibacterium granulatum TaxID=2036029 RepID=UPI00249B49D0|nr:hypothetical protein [Pontibacterium granulatum]MDI3326756.1 hypothetical protein [Pontibacterium granulatum]